MEINRRIHVLSVLVVLVLTLPAFPQGRRTRGAQPARARLLWMFPQPHLLV